MDLPTTPPVNDLIEQKTGIRDAAEAFNTDFIYAGADFGSDSTLWRAAFEQLGYRVPENAEIGGIGIAHIPPAGGSTGAAYHLRQMIHPLEVVTEVKQLEQLPWPDLQNPDADRGLAGRVAEIHRAGKVALTSSECTVFEFAWYLRGMDNLFGDLMEENGIAEWLLDWFTEFSSSKVRLSARAGVDVIGLGDDIGTQRGMMMSVDFWREHFKPRLKKVIDVIRAAEHHHTWIRYHSDGDIRLVIDDLAEMGVDILNPVQPECMPVDQVIAQHKHHLAFWGMIGTQTTMPFGTPDDVRSAVAQCARLAREGAALIVAPTHVLEPDVPWENIKTLVETVRGTTL